MRKLIPYLILLTALAGCSKPSVKVALSATANLNLNEAKEPLPVVVRVYQLADDGPFRKTEFNDLWKKDLAALGDSLLTKDEVVLNPAGQDQLTYPRHDRAKFIAVMAVFRRPGEKGWRDIKPVSKGFLSRRFSRTITVHLKGNTIDIVD